MPFVIAQLPQDATPSVPPVPPEYPPGIYQPAPQPQYQLPPRQAIPQGVAPPDTGAPPDAIGLAISWVSGSGLLYRHFFENDFGVQLAGVPYVTGDVAFLNFGGQVMYRWIKRYPFQLYGLLGAGYMYTKNTPLSVDSKGNRVDERADMGVAPGLGFDYGLTKNLWLTAQIGYTFGAQVFGSAMNSDFKPGFGIGTYFAF